MMYTEKVMEIFRNPQNVGRLPGANAIGKIGNVQCGDIMKIYLKINDQDVIEDASFETFGCAAAIVSSSVATTMIKGKTVEEALKLTNDDILKEVGELPVHKIHCSVLATEAIDDAIKNYRKKQAKEANKENKPKTGTKTKSIKEAKPAKTKPVKEEITQPKQPEVDEQAKANAQENLSKLRLLTSKIVRTTTTTTTTTNK